MFSEENILETVIDVYYRLMKIPTGCQIHKYFSCYQDQILFSSLSKEESIEKLELELYRSAPKMSKEQHNQLVTSWKNDIYKSIYCTQPILKKSINKTNSGKRRTIHENLFVFTWFCNATFCHSMAYGIILFYYFLKLKEELETSQSEAPNLKILLRINPNRYLLEVMDILDISSEMIIIDTSNDIIVNQGTTYMAGILQSSFTPDMINFYSQVIAKKSLLKYPVTNQQLTQQLKLANTHQLKKIVMLRKNSLRQPRLIANRSEVIDLCQQFGYQEVDQTLLNLKESIALINQATHLVTEAGSSVFHLAWLLNPENCQVTVLNYNKTYYNYLYLETPQFIKFLSLNSIFNDICVSKKAQVVHNDGIDPVYQQIVIEQNKTHFKNLTGLANTLKSQEN